MMKKKRYALLLAGMILLSLAGCGSREPLSDITDNSSAASASSDITSAESSEDIPSSPSVPAESENPAESVSETRQQTEVTKSPAKPTGTEDAAEPKQPAPAEEKTNPVSSAPQPEEPEPQKPTSAPTQPPAEEPPQSKPPQESTPPEEPAVPDFNIQTWIDFAAEYATSESVGLNLSPDATACWDNPITAGPHSLYLERDIQSRLNRYARDEDITDVWIWAEKRSDGSYDLYIGYA